MNERFRKNLVKYGVASFVALAFAAIHCYTKDITKMDTADVYRTLSDAFTAPGLLFAFSGTLAWLSREGALDGISYVAQYAVKSLLFFARRGTMETYKEYVERRREKKSGSYGFLFVVGAACVLIGTVFTALFYQTYR